MVSRFHTAAKEALDQNSRRCIEALK